MKKRIKSILKFIVIRIFTLKDDIFNINFFIKYMFQIFSKRIASRRVFIFGAPFHTNLGDQAQTYCIEKWVHENIPDSEIITMQNIYDFNSIIIFFISRIIKKEDLIICHSGYHFCELYQQYKFYEQVIKALTKNPVVIFPQTINFKSMQEALRVARNLDNHPNCLLMCRDEKSFNFAKKFFHKTKLLLYPDIVTSLIGSFDYNNKRNGILFCIRNDAEAYYGRNTIINFMKKFSPTKTDITDTYAQIKPSILKKNRRKILNETFESFSHYKLVITDRYHGTIFSLISNTPVIVLGTNDHKLESGIKWFSENEFKNYIYFAKNLEEAFKQAESILKNSPTKKLHSYFNQKYYNTLLEKISI